MSTHIAIPSETLFIPVELLVRAFNGADPLPREYLLRCGLSETRLHEIEALIAHKIKSLHNHGINIKMQLRSCRFDCGTQRPTITRGNENAKLLVLFRNVTEMHQDGSRTMIKSGAFHHNHELVLPQDWVVSCAINTETQKQKLFIERLSGK